MRMNTRMTGIVFPLVALCFASRLAGAEYSAVTGDLEVSEDSAVTGIANPGRTLSVSGGELSVSAGRGDFTLTENLRDGLVMWLDANVNAIEGEAEISERHGSVTNTVSGVVEWRDVRETETETGAFVYPRALVNRPDLYTRGDFASVPASFHADEENYPGLAMLDFGEFGSKRWMYVADAAGNLLNLNVRSFFMVVGFHSTMGHLLAHVTDLDNHDPNSDMFFHKHTGSAGSGPFAKADSVSSQWRRGETRINGVLVDPVATYPVMNGTMQLVSQIGPAYADIGKGMCAPYFNNFLNQGNLTEARDYQDRQGGAIFGEILIYDRVLSDAERKGVEAYLMAKWMARGRAGALDVAAGARAVLNGCAAVEGLRGAGEVEVAGESTALSGNAPVDTAAVRLTAGGISQTEKIAPLYLKPQGGKEVTVGFGGYSVRDIADSSRFSVVGESSGEIAAIAPGDAGNLTLAASGVKMVLSPRKEPVVSVPSWKGVNLLECSGFEGLYPSKAFQLLVTGDSPWTISGNVYCAKYTSDTWYGYPTTNSFGSGYVAIQGNSQGEGVMSQRFTAPITGLYRLSYWMSRRISRSEHDGETALKVSLDGQALFLDPIEKVDGEWDNELKYREYLLPPLEAGTEHELEFTLDDNGTTDRAAVLDEIALVPVEERDDVIYVPNAGFENASFLPITGISNGRFAGYADMRGILWTWNGVGGCGITRNSTWWSYRDGNPSEAAADRCKMYLQRRAAVSATVKVPRTGRIRFSMRLSNRRRESNYGYDSARCIGTFRKSGHSVKVSLGGTELVSIPVGSSERQSTWVSYHDYLGATGEVALTLENVLPDGSEDDITAIIDDISLGYAPEPETVAEDDGAVRTLQVAESGFYRLVLPMGCGETAMDDLDISKIWTERYPAAVKLLLDGEVVGGLRSESAEVRDYEYDLPWLAAGEHTLEIVPLGTGAAPDARMRVFDARLVRLGDVAGSGAYGLAEAKVLLENGATVDLRYSGALDAAKVRRGTEVKGTEISSSLYPAWVSGPGSMKFVRPGFLIFLR